MTDLSPIGAELSPASFIGSMISADMTATAGLQYWRDVGGSIRTQTWYDLWGEIRGAISGREGLQAVAGEAFPPASVTSTWAAGQPGQFSSRVQTYIAVPDQRELEVRWFTYTTEGPHTAEEALAVANDHLDQGLRTGTPIPGERRLGSVLTSYSRMTGRKAG